MESRRRRNAEEQLHDKSSFKSTRRVLDLFYDWLMMTLHAHPNFSFSTFAHGSFSDGFSNPSVQSRLRELYKLNKDILVSMETSVKNLKIDRLKDAFIGTTEQARINRLISWLEWRGVFDLLVAVIAAALASLGDQIEPLKSLD